MALRRRMKNFVKNYSEAEIKVRDATSNDPWGPSSSLMSEISDLTYNRVSVSEIMNMIWHRMNDYGKNWRHVYKSLTLLDYLLKNGSKKVIQHCQEGSYNIQILKDFHHIDEAGKDQGFYVREKAKQVIALLTDEQQLHNEREIARRTRQRTSYAMLLPPKTSDKSSSAIPASDPISEFPPSENIQYFSIKALPAAEQSETDQMSGNAEMAGETVAPNIITKKSPEDLIDFSEDEPPIFAVQSTFPTRVSKEELATDKKAATSTSRKAKTALTSYERLPAPKWDSSKKSKSSAVSSVPLKVPPKEETGANKVTESNKQFTKAAVICCSSEPSVETIYRSPTLQAFYPLGNSTINTTESTPASSMHFCGPCTSSLQTLDFSAQGTAQTAGLSSHPSRRPGSDSSVGTASSFYTFSTSSPESMSPNNTAQTHHISSHGSSYVSSPHGRPSLFFKDLKEKIAHFFSWVPDIDENEATSVLSLLPGNSKCSVRKKNLFRTSHASDGRLVMSLMHNIPSVPNPGLPSAANLSSADDVSSEQKSMATLEEIKNAVCGLRADFCSAAQDLHIIRGELTNVMISMQKMTPPQTDEGASGQK